MRKSHEPGGMNAHGKGGNNLLFADNHVEAAREFDGSRMTFHPKKPGQAWAMVMVD